MDTREVEKKKNDRKAKAAAGIILVAAIGLTFCVLYFGDLKRMATDPVYAREWFASHHPYSGLVFCLLTIVQIFAAFLLGEPLELAAGYAFGAVKGTLLCLLAEGIGSVIVLLLVRRFGPSVVRLFFTDEQLDQLKFLHYSPKRLLLFAVIFMMPGTPKDLLCYFAGLTDIDLTKLIIICTLGRIPSVVTSTLGGGAIGDRKYLLAVIVFAVTAALSLAGILFYNQVQEKYGSARSVSGSNEQDHQAHRGDGREDHAPAHGLQEKAVDDALDGGAYVDAEIQDAGSGCGKRAPTDVARVRECAADDGVDRKTGDEQHEADQDGACSR